MISRPLRRPRRDPAAWILGPSSFLIQVPFLRRGISLLDEGSILAIADALRRGEVLYADRATPLAPLVYELMGILFTAFGPSLLVGRLFQALVVSGCVLLSYAILRRLVAAPWAAAGSLAVLAVKPLGFPLWTIVNYSQLALLFALASVLMTLLFLRGHRPVWLAGAGLALGATLITKQNLGAWIAAATATTVALDWLRSGGRRPRPLAVRGGALLAGAAVPVAAALAFYARAGGLAGLLERAVLSLGELAQPYAIPLPGLRPWALRPGELDVLLFAHCPAPVVRLIWEGRLEPGSGPLLFGLELAVKAAYYLPLLALAVAVAVLWRGRRERMPRWPWSGLVLITAVAAAAYSSMLYRADWVHLMNVYPALLLLGTVLLEGWAGRVRWARWIAIAAAALWLAAGVAAGAAVFATQRAAVETPRGRLLAPPPEAREVRRVLSFLDRQPRSQRILFLRAEPLYYFLAGRPIPGPFDLVLPGFLTPGDDAEMARVVSAVDRIVYNPAPFPTVPSPITEYAPRTAAAVATGFRVSEVLGPTAVVLAPRAAAAPPATTVVDLWDRRESLRPVPPPGGPLGPEAFGPEGGVRRASWMVYRVVTAAPRRPGGPACFAAEHRARPGEALRGLPLLHPDAWAPPPGSRSPSARRALPPPPSTASPGGERRGWSRSGSPWTPSPGAGWRSASAPR